VKARKHRGKHRKRRPRRPLPGMLLHIDGSQHRWFCDDRWYEPAGGNGRRNQRVYYAQLVEEESTATVMAGLREVIEQQGVFCALYSDRASHFFLTPKAGGARGSKQFLASPNRCVSILRREHLKSTGTVVVATFWKAHVTCAMCCWQEGIRSTINSSSVATMA
jgi:hypothetical protein